MHVKKALEGIPGVAEVEVSHKKGEAVLSLNENVPDETLKKAVADEGYEVTDIR